MTNLKISELPTYTVPINTDLIPMVDVTNGITKKITFLAMRNLLVSSYPFLTVGFSNCDYICDGVADDVQIQAAIDAVYAAGGGIVYLKPGTYNIANNPSAGTISSTYFTYVGIIMKPGVRIIGAGIGNTILTTGDWPVGTLGAYFQMFTYMTGAVLDYAGAESFSIILPTPMGGALTWVQDDGIAFTGSHVIFKDLYIYGGVWSASGTVYSWNGTTKELTTDCYDCLVDNVTCDSFVASSSLNYTKYVTLRDIKFINGHDDNILVRPNQHLKIINPIFDGENNSAMSGSLTAMLYIFNDGALTTDVDVFNDIQIINPTFRRCALPAGNNAAMSFRNAKSIKVIGGLVEDVALALYSDYLIDDLLIDGMTIRNTSGYAMYFNSSTVSDYQNITITNMKIHDNGGYGLVMFSGKTGTTIRNIHVHHNQFYDTQVTATQTGWVSISATGAGVDMKNVMVDHNIIYRKDGGAIGGGVGPISGATGSNIIVRNNDGYVTENSGTGTIASGATSAVITHGLSLTPTLQDIIITLGENPTNTPGAIWVDTIGATYFTVNCENDPGASNLDFAWKAIVTKTSW